MIFDQANKQYTYPSFLEYASNEVTLNESQPDRVADPKYAFYSKLNLQRMRRWTKTFVPDELLVQKLKQSNKQSWYVITEAWCGDSAQNLPILAAIADAAGIALKIVLRDENPAIIDQYLTNGTKSIPILVSFDADDQQLFIWGPRPAGAQVLMVDWKENPNGRDFEAFELELHAWYAKNKGEETQKELSALIN